mgnify:CR=1 FL=1
MERLSQVGVGLIGAGRAGMVHARDFFTSIPEARMVAVFDANAEAAAAAASELNATAYTDLDAFYANPDLDAVVIATPTFTHADHVVRAAHEKKAILCEKPVAISPEEVIRMEEALKATGVTFLMAFMRRFDDSFIRAREAIQNGEIGDVILVKSTGKGPGLAPPWSWDIRKSNGVLAEVNSHDIDCIRWLTGREFEWVFARGGNFRTPELREDYPDYYDNVVMVAGLTGGVLSTVDGACPSEYGYDARVEIQGTEGVLFIGSVARPGLTVCTKKGVTAQTMNSWRNLFREAYVAEDRHFINCVLGREKPKTTLEDGARALAVVRAGTRSLLSGKVETVDDWRAS